MAISEWDQGARDGAGRARLAAKMIEAMPEPAVLVESDGHCLAANRPAVALLPALRPGEPLVRALRSPDVLDAFRRVVADGDAETVIWSERVPVERLFDVHVAPIRSDRGVVEMALLTVRDLTEGRRLERMRADFIANASHELRTPLASMLGFIETLQGSAREDETARDRFLVIMREQGRRMARLIEDLLSLSRIEQKQHVRPDASIDLAQVARHVADTLSPLAHEFGAEIRVAAKGPVTVAGDRDELVRVAENLIDNAIKYGTRAGVPQGGLIEVTVESRGRDGALTVRDHGRGIPSEHLPRLTERFYRVDVGQSRAKNGTGLGLAIVKHILARHRGRLTIASRPNDGSTFSALIPLHERR